MLKWMNSQSRITLLRESLKSLDPTSERDLNIPTWFEVRDGMEKLSESSFDDLEAKLEEMGTSISSLAEGYLIAEGKMKCGYDDDDDSYDAVNDLTSEPKFREEMLKLASDFLELKS